MFVHSLPIKSRNRLANDIMYTFAAHLHDITDLVRNSSTHGHALMILNIDFKH